MRVDLGQIVYVQRRQRRAARRLRLAAAARRWRSASRVLQLARRAPAARRAHARPHVRGASARSRASRGSGEHGARWLAIGVAGQALDRRAARRAGARATRDGRRRLRAEHGDQAARAPAPAGARRPAAADRHADAARASPARTRRPRSPARSPTRASGCRRRRCTRSRAALALSRLYLGVHYPSDVLAGALLGTAARLAPCAPTRRGRRAAREHAHRHRRHAQRGQVLAVQRADESRRRGRQLPVHDDRAERRRRAGARRAPRARSRRPSAPRRSCGTRSTSTTSPASSRARTRARVSATASSRTSARPTRSCTSCARTATRAWSTPRAASIRLRDIETIETELALADLEQAERRIERVARQARGGDRAAVAEEAWLRAVIEALQAGRPARTRARARGGAQRRRATWAR